jgi:hypothetical protein
LKFKPFRIILTMRTPVVITAVAPTLDGLLFEAMSQRFCDDTPAQVVERLKGVLAFHDGLQVFHASSMKFGVTSQCGLSVWNYCRSDNVKNKLDSSMFMPHGRKGTYPPVLLVGGPTKTRLTKRLAYKSAFVCFDGLGDAKAVAALLEHTFVGVGYDAQNCGMGEFDHKQIEVITLEQDESLTSKGQAMRPLPAAAASGIESELRLLPPYYLATERVHAVMPSRVQLLNIDLV